MSISLRHPSIFKHQLAPLTPNLQELKRKKYMKKTSLRKCKNEIPPTLTPKIKNTYLQSAEHQQKKQCHYQSQQRTNKENLPYNNSSTFQKNIKNLQLPFRFADIQNSYKPNINDRIKINSKKTQRRKTVHYENEYERNKQQTYQYKDENNEWKQNFQKMSKQFGNRGLSNRHQSINTQKNTKLSSYSNEPQLNQSQIFQDNSNSAQTHFYQNNNHDEQKLEKTKSNKNDQKLLRICKFKNECQSVQVSLSTLQNTLGNMFLKQQQLYTQYVDNIEQTFNRLQQKILEKKQKLIQNLIIEFETSKATYTDSFHQIKDIRSSINRYNRDIDNNFQEIVQNLDIFQFNQIISQYHQKVNYWVTFSQKIIPEIKQNKITVQMTLDQAQKIINVSRVYRGRNSQQKLVSNFTEKNLHQKLTNKECGFLRDKQKSSYCDSQYKSTRIETNKKKLNSHKRNFSAKQSSPSSVLLNTSSVYYKRRFQ